MLLVLAGHNIASSSSKSLAISASTTRVASTIPTSLPCIILRTPELCPKSASISLGRNRIRSAARLYAGGLAVHGLNQRGTCCDCDFLGALPGSAQCGKGACHFFIELEILALFSIRVHGFFPRSIGWGTHRELAFRGRPGVLFFDVGSSRRARVGTPNPLANIIKKAPESARENKSSPCRDFDT